MKPARAKMIPLAGESAAELRAVQKRLHRSLRFPPKLEAQYREAQSRRYRTPRMILFGATTLGFVLAPVFSPLLFKADPLILPLLILLQLGVAAPMQLLGMTASLRAWSEQWRRGAQTAAISAMWGCLLTHQLLATQGLLNYPTEMLGINVMAIAVLGGYRPQRFIIGSSLVLSLSVLVTWYFDDGSGRTATQIFTTTLMWLVAVAGALSTELLSRHSWLSHRYARSLAMTDGVTGLLSRRMFDEVFIKTLAAARRAHASIGLALVDIDHFKSVNDRFGHDMGDEVLARFAGVLRTAARRPLDLCARYGGEEFILVWYDTDGPMVSRLVTQLQDAIRAMHYEAGQPPEQHRLTASIGATWFHPGREDERRALTKTADELLYRAKAAGRDRAMTAPFQRGAAR